MPNSLEVEMADLTNDEIRALGRSVGLDIQEPELTQVGYGLNAILEAMAAIEVPGANLVEPLPLILPNGEARDER